MPFNDILSRYKDFDAEAYCASVTGRQVERALSKGRLDEHDYLALLSPAASDYIERMALRARDITRAHFGNTILLFTPLYVSNICDNFCPYCSFAHQNKITRRHLTIDEVKKEAEHIAATGMRHILMLTGESRKGAPVQYIRDCVAVMKDFFSSIAIEVYPLDKDEYAELVECGADGLTVYQETYNRDIYADLHKGGPKENFDYRLSAPERACLAGIRSVTVGALLGLAPPLMEAFFSGLHARYLRDAFPSLEISASFPRLRPQVGKFETDYAIDDRTLVQYMTAFRIFMPNAGITVSTREPASLRDSILPMGPTKMSAGVNTAVGAATGGASEPQFEIADDRPVDKMQKDLLTRGFQPVMVDWNFILCR
ncbi:MAG: 2-iminoacetate synthase ThiH [Chitinispirillales bacterium]|jgi:2-iminoacetate synthase|nr:2-iminoacetate synthase ThiH [Chitinispirillales bacterium]